ncbi:MAG: ATP synthase F1 subunit delta [Bacteroidales bacterium]|nr:ATP synthase F1 subunit delta [Bacteroidales bacterium]
MNTGIIASRYATALYKWVGADDATASLLCSQAKTLVVALSLEKLRFLLRDASLRKSEKLSLLEAALAPEKMSPKMAAFIEMVADNGRISELRFILNSYINLYYKERNIHFAKVVSAYKPSPEIREKITGLAEDLLHGTVVMEESVDPDLIGGVVVEVDGYRYDASVRTALKTVKEQFRQQNKRII